MTSARTKVSKQQMMHRETPKHKSCNRTLGVYGVTRSVNKQSFRFVGLTSVALMLLSLRNLRTEIGTSMRMTSAEQIMRMRAHIQ